MTIASKKPSLIDSVAVVSVLVAVVAVGLMVRQQFFLQGAVSHHAPIVGVPVKNPGEYETGGHRIGPNEAKLVIVEFSDFECPFCGDFARNSFKQVSAEYPGKIALIYRHFPITSHRFALPAARASECAAAQGKFVELHDLLFELQDSLGLITFHEFAARAGVPDTALFSICSSSGKTAIAIAQDIAAGKKLGVEGTPTLLIDGKLYGGNLRIEALDSLVKQILSRSQD